MSKLSQGWAVSAVLLLDVSGSMHGDKLEKAKAAAINCIRSAPLGYQLAAVSFSNTANVLGGFTETRETLSRRVGALGATGRTALQDGVAAALDLLRSREGRKVILLLTDGIENDSQAYAGEPGRQNLLRRVQQEGCSIFPIGLGDDVKVDYLRSFEQTGGTYLFSPTANELQQVFQQSIKLLQREVAIEYQSARPEMDGAVRNVSVDLAVNGVITDSRVRYPSPGVIPHVPGHHLPWLVLLGALLCLPGAHSLVVYFVSVFRFRRTCVRRYRINSARASQKELSDGSPLRANELVVLCPVDRTPHRVRSWRMHGCKCPRDATGKGSFCYHQKLPRAIRYLLDDLSGRSTNWETGRNWLCFCAGDKSKDRSGY